MEESHPQSIPLRTLPGHSVNQSRSLQSSLGSRIITGKDVVTTWFMSFGQLMFVNYLFHRFVAGRMHQPTSEICFETPFGLHVTNQCMFAVLYVSRWAECVFPYIVLNACGASVVFLIDHLVRIKHVLFISEFHDIYCCGPSYRLSRCTQFHNK